MQQFKTHQTQTRHYDDNPSRYHPLYVTNKHKHESEAGLLHLEKAKPLERNWFCSLTFEDKEIVGESGKVVSFPFVSRLSLSLCARLCFEGLCGLCGWKAALLDPDQVIDSTTQECPISFLSSFVRLSSPWDDLHLLSQRVGSLSVGTVRSCSLSSAAFSSTCRPAGSRCFYRQPHGPCAADSQTCPRYVWQMTSHFCPPPNSGASWFEIHFVYVFPVFIRIILACKLLVMY